MGEEEKKLAEEKDEVAKNEKPPVEEGKKSEESKAEQPQPQPPAEIVLRVFMHCEGCARKIRRCLKGFQGVEEVITDCQTSKVVVRGEKADPLKVWERVQKKSHSQVDLISPIPIPNPKEEEPPKPPEKDLPKPQQEEQLPVMTVVLGVYMHCEACAHGIRKRIQRMKGVESAEPDLKSSQVVVKGAFVPEKLVEYVYRRMGKHATTIKVEPEKKQEKEKEAEKKTGEGQKEEETAVGGEASATTAGAEDSRLELKKNESSLYREYPHNYNLMYPQRFVHESSLDYQPQMFSDENPNACSVM